MADNENVYVVPGVNVFECMECGRDFCSVWVPVSLEMFHRVSIEGKVEVQAQGRICGRSQSIMLKRPAPPPGLDPKEVQRIVHLLVQRLKTKGRS